VRKELLPVRRYVEIPKFATDEEFAAFWDTHAATEELLTSAPAAGRRNGIPAGNG
jgi:hypothetical protein